MASQSPNGFVIELINPCDKRWDEMKALSNNSGYCHSCNKVLTNFSEMSDTEVLNWFQNHSNIENACGFWHQSQLNRPFRQPIESKHEQTNNLKQFLFSILMFLGILNAQGQSVTANDSSIKTEQLDTGKKVVSKFIYFDKNTITGIIKLDNHWMLKSNAIIKIKETGDSIVSDSFGRFYFNLPDYQKTKNLTFEINYKNISDTIVLKTKSIENYTEFVIKKKTKGVMIHAGRYDKKEFESNHLLFEIWKKGNW